MLRVWKDTSRVDSLRLQAVQSVIWDGLMQVLPDSAYHLAHEQLMLSRQKGAKKWEGKALYNIGTYCYWKGEYAAAFSWYRQSLDIRKQIGDLKGEAAIYGNFGLIYNQQGNNLKALDFQLKSLELNLKLKDTAGITTNYNNLAMIYQDQSNPAKALAYYDEVLKLYDPKRYPREIALTYNNIGNVYSNDSLPLKALEYLYKSLAIRRELNDQIGMAVNFTNLGANYARLARYDSAFFYVQKSIGLFEALGDKASCSSAYFNMGDLAFKQGRYAGALTWCEKSLLTAGSIDKVPVQRMACHCLYQVHKKMGNAVKALYYHEKYKLYSDSLKKGEIELRLSQLEFDKEILTDSLAQEEEKQALRAGYQADLNRKTQLRNAIMVAGIGVLLLSLLFLSRMLYFQKRSERFQLQTQQLENQQLVNEIALLKTQVNPHFLFNSLSILSSLVHVNADLSEQFIDRLSRSYRYILEQKDQTLVSLRTELEFIRSYSFLLKIRFENKFDLQLRLVDADLDRFKIAPLTLQLLVENAVKHNRMSVAEPLIVEVFREDKYLIVRNRLQTRPQREDSTRTGLNNIIHRYALMGDNSVWAGETEGFFLVKISLFNS